MKRLVCFCTVSLLFGMSLFGQGNSRLDPTNFVVVGGGWAAGYADFQLLEQYQKDAFPRLMARQMNTISPMPLFRPLGPPTVVAVDPLPSVLPAQGQTVLRTLPFPLFAFNLSVPYIKAGESLRDVPSLPLVHEGDLKQTLLNLVLGYPLLILDEPPRWTQIQYAELMAPTLVLLQLGMGDVLEAALTGDVALITPPASFSADFEEIAGRMERTYAQVVVLNVPDPVDMPFFWGRTRVAETYQTTPEELQALFGLGDADRVTLAGMVQIGDTLRGRRSGGLTTDAVLRGDVAAAISSAVESYNQTIQSAASLRGFPVYDLHALVRQVQRDGIEAGSRHLGGGYMEGFYSPDGLFPTATAHGVLVNELLGLLNSRYGTNFPLVDIGEITAGESALAPRSASTAPDFGPLRSRRPGAPSIRRPGGTNR